MPAEPPDDHVEDVVVVRNEVSQLCYRRTLFREILALPREQAGKDGQP